MANKLLADLKAYALSHYAEGGQWVVECFDDADYEQYLKKGFKNAKKALKAYWTLKQGYYEDIAATAAGA